MNGKELNLRVEKKLGEERSQEHRMAVLEVYQEVLLERLESLPCTNHQEKIHTNSKMVNWILGGVAALGFAITLGIAIWALV